MYPRRGSGGGVSVRGGYGCLGEKPPAAGRFFVSFGRKSYFNAIGSHFARVHSHLKELDF